MNEISVAFVAGKKEGRAEFARELLEKIPKEDTEVDDIPPLRQRNRTIREIRSIIEELTKQV